MLCDAPIVLRQGKGTALHHATNSGHPEVVSILLEKGADPNAQDNRGERPGDRFDAEVRQGAAFVLSFLFCFHLVCFVAFRLRDDVSEYFGIYMLPACSCQRGRIQVPAVERTSGYVRVIP